MFLPAHLAAGLIVGKITGQYTPALIGALTPDLDHAISYIKHGILLKPKLFLTTITDTKDPWSDQRSILHNVIIWAVISGGMFLVNSDLGLIIGLSYLSHLILDTLDNSDFYPPYPTRESTCGVR